MDISCLESKKIQLALEPCVEPDCKEKMKRGMEARRRWLLNRANQGLRILVALERLSPGEKKSVGLMSICP